MNTTPPCGPSKKQRPNLHIDVKGKGPAYPRLQATQGPAAPAPKRPRLPREQSGQQSKMAMDFYIASMLDSQVRQLMTEGHGQAPLERVPTPYRKFLVSETPPPERAGPGEDAVDADLEAGVTWLEYAFDNLDAFWAYVYSFLPGWLKPARTEAPHELPQWTQQLGPGHTPTYVIGGDPDTPGSQATPKGIAHADPSYFTLK